MSDVPSSVISPETSAGSTSPAIASISSRWPLPSTPAMPTISPARTSNDTPLTTRFEPAPHREVADAQRHAARFRRRLVDAQQHLAADHQARQLRRARVFRLDAADDLAVAHHRHVVGDREHLRQLVRDDDDRLSLLAHAAKDGEELLDFLRRQHGGRLVENQQLRVPVERLQQLDALLLADRQTSRRARADRPTA